MKKLLFLILLTLTSKTYSMPREFDPTLDEARYVYSTETPKLNLPEIVPNSYESFISIIEQLKELKKELKKVCFNSKILESPTERKLKEYEKEVIQKIKKVIIYFTHIAVIYDSQDFASKTFSLCEWYENLKPKVNKIEKLILSIIMEKMQIIREINAMELERKEYIESMKKIQRKTESLLDKAGRASYNITSILGLARAFNSIFIKQDFFGSSRR